MKFKKSKLFLSVPFRTKGIPLYKLLDFSPESAERLKKIKMCSVVRCL